MLGARFSREVIGLGLAIGVAFALVEPLTRLMSDGPSSWSSSGTLPSPSRNIAAYNLNLVPYGIDRGFCDRAAVARDLKDGLVAAASLLVRSTLGTKMDETDQECVSNVLEYAPDRQRVLWRNSNNGLTYTVMATQTYQTDRGIYCREYSASAVAGGEPLQIQANACRQPSGTWSVVH